MSSAVSSIVNNIESGAVSAVSAVSEWVVQ